METSPGLRARTTPTLRQALRAADSYGLLLALLIASYILFSLSRGPGNRLVLAAIAVAVLMLALHTSQVSKRWLRVGGVASAIALVVASFDTQSLPGGRAVSTLAAIATTMLLVGAPLAILTRILGHRRVSIETILGAVCVYMLIGFVFAAFYSVVDAVTAESFFVGGQDPASRAEVLYYSFVVLTTLGFGDLTVAGNFGRSISVLEAVVGQIFLVTLVARLVGLFGRSSDEQEYT